MAGRPITGSFSEDLAKTPGPGRYDNTNAETYQKKGPAYSMLGRRTKGSGKMSVLHISLTQMIGLLMYIVSSLAKLTIYRCIYHAVVLLSVHF